MEKLPDTLPVFDSGAGAEAVGVSAGAWGASNANGLGKPGAASETDGGTLLPKPSTGKGLFGVAEGMGEAVAG